MTTPPSSTEPTEQSSLLRRPSTARSRDTEHDAADPDARPQLSVSRAAAVMVFFGVLIFLQSSNFSVMSTTSSEVAEDLHAYDSTSWFTSAYLISMSSLAPLAGRLSQIFDPRGCACVAGILFAIGALFTSQAHTLTMFLAGRAVQGVGAAGIYTLSVNLVLYLAPPKRRGLLIGAANASITLGVSLGAVIGGEMVEGWGWRPLFWIQFPIALVSVTGLFFSIPPVSSLRPGHSAPLGEKLASIDYIGSVLLVGTLTSFLIGLASPTILVFPLLLALALFLVFLVHERSFAASPVIPLPVLASRGVLLSCAGQLTFMTTRWCVLFYAPVYTLAVRGWAPAIAGTILIPTNLGFALGGLGVGFLHIRRGGSFWGPTLVCLGVFPATVVVLAALATAVSPAALFVAVVFVNGALAGAALNYSLAHLLHVTAPGTHFVATALLATARGFAGSFGAGIGGGLFARTLRAALEDGFVRRGLCGGGDTSAAAPCAGGREALIQRLLGSPALVRRLAGAERAVAVEGYAAAVQALFVAGAVLAGAAAGLQAGTGWRSWEERSAAGPGWWRRAWWRVRGKEAAGGEAAGR